MIDSLGDVSDSSSDLSGDVIIDWLKDGDRDTIDFNGDCETPLGTATGIDLIDATLSKSYDGNDHSGSPNLSVGRSTSTTSIDLSTLSDYIRSHKDVYLALLEVEDLYFSSLSIPKKERLMKSVDVQLYQPGETILEFGESSQDFYIVLASAESKRHAHVEILSKSKNVVTHLHRGQIFGHMFFLMRQARNRNASVWVPVAAKSCPVWIGRVPVEKFDEWSSYRENLIMQSIPFIANMPLQDKLNVVRLATFRYFTSMEIILSQGDVGDDFFIILDGVAQVMEWRPGRSKVHAPYNKKLATLRAGHCFGEMALINSKPRNASVICTSDLMTCLSWSKDVFDSSLSADFRASVISLINKRSKTRIMRESNSLSHKRSDSKSGSSASSSSPSVQSSEYSSLVTPFATSVQHSEKNLLKEQCDKENEPLNPALSQEREKKAVLDDRTGMTSVSTLTFASDDLNSITKNTGFESFVSPDPSHEKHCDNLMVKDVTSVISSRTSGSVTPARRSPKIVDSRQSSSGDNTPDAGSNDFGSDTMKGHLTMSDPNMNLTPPIIEHSKADTMEDKENVEYVRQQIIKLKKLQSTHNHNENAQSTLEGKDYVYDTPPSGATPDKPPVTMTKELVVTKSTAGDRILNDKYMVIKEIGKGSFGLVLKVQDTQTGEFYAMKTISRALLDLVSGNALLIGSPSRRARDKFGYLKLSPKQNDPIVDDSSTLSQSSCHDMTFEGFSFAGDECKDYLDASISGSKSDNGDDESDDSGNNRSDSNHSANANNTSTPTALTLEFLGSKESWSDVEGIAMEVKIMKRLRHENIVSLHEVIDDPLAKKIYLIQEFMEGPLMEHSIINEPLSPGLTWKYFREIVKGLHYLFKNGIVHRDIKPQNILISRDGVAKIADFGAAVLTGGHEKSKYAGTPAFTAPELNVPMEEREEDFSRMPCIDIFALGATLYNMAVGHPPWMANSELDLAAKIQNLEPLFPADIDPHLKYLILRMLDKDYRSRYTMEDILRDEWVTDENSVPLLTEFSESSEFSDESDEEKDKRYDQTYTDSDEESYGEVVAGSEDIMAVLDQLNSSANTPCSEVGDSVDPNDVFAMPGDSLPTQVSRDLNSNSENLEMGIRVGTATSIGTRDAMEDFYLADCNADSGEYGKEAIFGVFDGHNGISAANYIRSYLQSRLATSISTDRDTKDVLRKSFALIDIDLLSQSLKEYMKRKYCEPQNTLKPTTSIVDTGSTAVVVVLEKSEDSMSMKLTVANCGDSRCVLRREDGTVVQCSNDHRPTNASERPRIEASGTPIVQGRIHGVMSLSRSIGDFNYKFVAIKERPLFRDISTDVQHLSMKDVAMIVSQWKENMLTEAQNNEFWSRNFEHQPITSEPEMYELTIPLTSEGICEEIEFLLIGSDGLFDHISNEDAIKSVRRQLLIHRSVERAARHLIKKVQRDPKANDNITVIVVVFGQK